MADDGIEMENTALTVKKTDEDVSPQKRYSSSTLVTAADELKFKTKKAAEIVKKKEKEGKLSKKEAKEQLKAAYKTLAHTYDKNTLANNYNTDLKTGLTNEGYQQALEEYGENKLTPPKEIPWYVRLLLAIFGGFFNVLLWLGSILCFIAYAADPTRPRDQGNV